MGFAGEYVANHFRGRHSDGFAPMDQPRRRPLQMRLMTLGRVLVNGGVPVSRRTAGVGRDALAILEKLDGGCGVAGFELLAGKLIRNAVIVPVDLDVVVDIGP